MRSFEDPGLFPDLTFLQNSYRWVGMPDISNVQKSPFLKTKQKKDGENSKRKGVPANEMYEIYISVDKIQKYI